MKVVFSGLEEEAATATAVVAAVTINRRRIREGEGAIEAVVRVRSEL